MAVAAGVAVVFACLSVGATAAPAPFLLTFDGRIPPTPLCSTGSPRRSLHCVRAVVPRRTGLRRGHPTDEGGFLNVLASTRATTAAAASRRICRRAGRARIYGLVEDPRGHRSVATLRGLGPHRHAHQRRPMCSPPSATGRTGRASSTSTRIRRHRDVHRDPRKLRLRLRTYALQVGLAARDPSAPVSYTVDVRAGDSARLQERLDGVWANNDHASIRPPRTPGT